MECACNGLRIVHDKQYTDLVPTIRCKFHSGQRHVFLLPLRFLSDRGPKETEIKLSDVHSLIISLNHFDLCIRERRIRQQWANEQIYCPR